MVIENPTAVPNHVTNYLAGYIVVFGVRLGGWGGFGEWHA